MTDSGIGRIARLARATRSLRFKATVAVASFIVMISVLLSTLFVIHSERDRRLDALRTLEDVTVLLAETVTEAVSTGKADRARLVIQAAERDPRILYVAVRGRSGPLATFRKRCSATLGERLEREEPPSAPTAGVRRVPLEHEGHTYWDFVAPVPDARGSLPSGAPGKVPGAEPAGTLRAVATLDPVRASAEELRWRTAMIALGMIFLGTAGTMFLVGTIVGPIQDLARATERVAEGDLDVQMEPRSGDEVGVLIHSFNKMVDRLREAKERQASWSRDLEQRVEEKTREIQQTRENLANIVENVGASILVADLDGSIVSANTHTMRIFGTKPEWTVGRNLHEFTCDPSYDSESLRALLESGGGPFTYEARHRVDESTEMDLLITHTLLRDSRGRAAGILQITKDITELKGIEQRLVDSDRLSRMGEMAGEIGHELNNYLMAIGGRAELIPMALDRGKSDMIRQSAEIIVGQVAEMRKLTDGLLESARKESSPAEIDLNEVVRKSVEFVRPQNKFDRVALDVDLRPGVLPIFADPQQIRQVLLNLLSNGAEAIHEKGDAGGTIRIETFREGSQAGFRVSDDGIGIESEARKRIFEPHFTTRTHGHGFGLAVCHRVVSTHRGRISVKSVPGRGAAFTVRLPALPPREEPQEIASPAAAGATRTVSGSRRPGPPPAASSEPDPLPSSPAPSRDSASPSSRYGRPGDTGPSPCGTG